MTDAELLLQHDHHISGQELESIIRLERVYIAEHENVLQAAEIRPFLDNTPFMNMLYLLEDFRRQGFGTELMRFWEGKMGKAGYGFVMTSTASNECAQHFYYKLGYTAIGGFCPEGEPYELLLARSCKYTEKPSCRSGRRVPPLWSDFPR